MFKLPYDKIRKLYVSRLWPVLPFSFAIAGICTLIEPKTRPTFADATDWIAFWLFILGLFIVFILHACILYQMTSTLNRGRDDYWSAIQFGLNKMPLVFSVSLIMFITVPLGLIALVLPGIYLFIIGAFALFLVVLRSDLGVKQAFISSYRLATPHWLKIALIMLTLTILFSCIEYFIDWIFREGVVFSSLFFILTRALLWPLWYATIIILLFKLHRMPIEELIGEDPN